MNDKSNKGPGKVITKGKRQYEPGTRMSVLMSNPDYLLEGYAEKHCQYLGIIEDIPTSADMSSRGFLLSALDEKRNQGQLPWVLSRENDVAVTLSAFYIKIIKEDRTGTLLHRLPIHEISSASYVCDDDQHLVFIKAGNATRPCCPCHVLSCTKRADAEEICHILQEAFQLVYTEATMEHLTESISAGETGGNTTPRDKQEYVSAEILVQEYMERLHKLLDFKELGQFAALLKRYRDDLPVVEFLSQLNALYGQERRFLIPGMNPFIPEEDKEEFERFLKEQGLEKESVARVSPVRRGVANRHSRVANIDKFLNDIDSQMDSVLEDSTNF